MGEKMTHFKESLSRTEWNSSSVFDGKTFTSHHKAVM